MIQKKVCLLGATGVGKTSLVKQFVEGIFSDKYLTSIGVKVDKKQIETATKTVQLMLWDIEGIDRYCGFQAKYLRGAAAFILVTDQTRSQSLEEGLEILALIRKATDIPGILVLNKSDLPACWNWNNVKIEEKSHHFNHIFNTSAKTGDGVETMFSHLAHLLVE